MCAKPHRKLNQSSLITTHERISINMLLNNARARTKLACVSASLIVFLVCNIYPTNGGRAILRKECGRGSYISRESGQRSRDGSGWNDESYSNESWSPKSDRERVTSTLKKMFLSERNTAARTPTQLRDKLESLGFEDVIIQKGPDQNVIAILPSKHWRTDKDKIILIGAHWDTVEGAPGVEDNGSGCTATFELARLVKRHKCTFSHTIMFAWFGGEEQGLFGSNHLVNNYLYKEVIEKYGSSFAGAYITDMIMVNDSATGSQYLPSYMESSSPDFYNEVRGEWNRGDFLTLLARRTFDDRLVNAFRKSWSELGFEKRRLKLWQCALPNNRPPNRSESSTCDVFSKSDHFSFWYPPIRYKDKPITSRLNRSSLSAVILSDLALWRDSYTRFYHKPCDNKHFITDSNLSFLQKAIDTLMRAVLKLGEGCCSMD